MYSVKPPLIFVFLLLYFSSSDATIDNIDPSKYTVKFTYDGSPYRCLAGIISERLLISAVGCFANRDKRLAIDSTLLKAVIGSVEVPVAEVRLPKFSPSEGFVLLDYAFVYLGHDLNLEKNGLTTLGLPVKETKVDTSAVVSRSDGGSGRGIVKIADSNNCPRGDVKVNYNPENHLCVELPTWDDRCLDEDLGAPLVAQGDDGVNRVIGVHLNCYDNLAYGAFASANFGVGKPGQFVRADVLYSIKRRVSANANIDPSKYTVSLKIDGSPYRCLAGIIGERLLITAVGCFSNGVGRYNVDYKLMKAVIGSVKVPVFSVVVPKSPPSEGYVVREYALVHLEHDLNLKKNGLTTLYLPVEETKVNSAAVVSRSDGGSGRGTVTIADSNDCPQDDDKVKYNPENHLCVELPTWNDRCLNKDLGAPLVARGDDDVNYVIGVYLNCYENLAYEVFASTYSEKPSQFVPAPVDSRHHTKTV